ncbi:MAG: cupin-like domain-containing protein [Myxococcales bacterium]|nr:cupin-like domain-containing protein [Myxococcales bacterium]
MAEEEPQVVHPQWRAWVAHNLARGAAPEALVEALGEEGVPTVMARAVVDELDASPGMHEARALQRRVAALELMLRLRREHRALGVGLATIERRPLPAVEDFVARYLVPGVPVVLTDLVTRWPALERWTPAALAARLGDATIEACVGREAAADPDATWQPLCAELPLRVLLDRITRPGPSNDTYVIAKNAALRRPALQPLLDDLVLPPAYFGPRMDPTRMGLWIGPAGTHTPLHHDGDDSMFCQVVGRKRFRLAPPESIELLDRSRGVYSHWDPRDEAQLAEGPPLLELVLEPGEALFIPSGWWHQVDALDPSLSVSILALAWPNDFPWYRPGSVLRGSVPT